MGGLGHVEFTSLTIGGETWPGVQVWTDHPAESCMASQYAGWAINPEGFFAMGSGPLRAKARVERELFGKLGYAEAATRGVLVLEGRALPTDDVAAWVARQGRARPGRAHVRRRADRQPRRRRADRRARARNRPSQDGNARLRRRPASSARWAPRRCRRRREATCGPSAAPTTAFSTAARPATPCGPRTRSSPSSPKRLPASASADYGTPFYDIFKRYDNDFYKIDPMLFSPAEVWLTSATSGRTFHAGRLDADVLRASLFD